MTLTRLVFRNMTGRRGRFILTLLGMTVGIAACVTFLALGGSLRAEIERETAALGANLIVTPKGSCAFEQVSILTGEQLPSNITRAEYDAIRSLAGLTVLPFLSERTAIANQPVPILGIEPQPVRALRGWEVATGRYLADSDRGVVLGAAVADRFRLGPGDEVTLRGNRLPVQGVLAATGGKDDNTLFLPLATAQQLYAAEDRYSYLAVQVAEVAQVESMALRIRDISGLGVVTDKQMLKSVLSIVGTVNVTLQLVAAVAVLAAAFGIVNTMLTAIHERKREIGILQALGARRRDIFAAFIFESGLYGLFGGICGALLGLAGARLAAPLIEQNAMTAFVKGSGTGTFDPLMLPGAVAISIVIAVLAGLYPAWQAVRLTPVEAINHD